MAGVVGIAIVTSADNLAISRGTALRQGLVVVVVVVADMVDAREEEVVMAVVETGVVITVGWPAI